MTTDLVKRLEALQNLIPTLKQCVHYCPQTGALTWLPRPQEMFNGSNRSGTWNTRYAGQPAFSVLDSKGYLAGKFCGYHLRAHQVAWAIHNDAWPSGEIDHINGNATDNRIINLRAASRKLNAKNLRRYKSNKFGAPGIRQTGKRTWTARINDSGKEVHIGSFDTPEKAFAARKAAERKYGYHVNHGRAALLKAKGAGDE